MADLLPFVYFFSQSDDLTLQLRYYLLQLIHFISFLVILSLILIPNGLDPLLLIIQLPHLLVLFLQLILLTQQLSLQLHLMIDIQFLHLKQQFFIVRYGLDQPSYALYYLPSLLLIFAVLLVAFVEGIEQHAQELPGLDAEVVVYVDVGVDEEVDLGYGRSIFELLG